MNYLPFENTRPAPLGRKSEAALHSLHAHGPQTRLQIEIRLPYGPMADALKRLRDLGFARCERVGGAAMWRATQKGLAHLGVASEGKGQVIDRVNSFTTRGLYDPEKHHAARIGLATYSTSTRFSKPIT